MGRPANDAPTRFTATVKGREYSRARWRGRVFHLGPAGTDKAEAAWSALLRRVADDPAGGAELDAAEVLVPQLFVRYLGSPDAPRSPRAREFAALAGETLVGGGPPGVAGAPGGLDLRRAPVGAVTGKDWKRWRRWLCALPRAKRDGTPHPGGGTRYAASSVRQMVKAAVRAYQWGASEGLVTPDALKTAEAAAALSSGDARPNRKRAAAHPAHVAAARPFLRPMLRAAVDLMLLTGGRPNEVFRVGPADLHTAGEVEVAGFGLCDLSAGRLWVFTPADHKTAAKGFTKAVWFTPEAQAVLAPWIAGLAPGEFAFGPDRDLLLRSAERKAAARRPRENKRLAADPGWRPGRRYNARVAARGIARACRKAGVPVWTPYQLRHLAKRQLEERYGVETARMFLGHATTDMTDKYGGFSFELVRKVAASPPVESPPAG